MSVFAEYAAYYNLLYREKDYQAEVNYVASLLKQYAQGDISTILDLGCGTGRHDLLFAEKGYQVTGVDQSAEMLDIASRHVPESLRSNVSFRHADIRTARLDQQFDAIVSLFHVASYQISNHDLSCYFECAARHLKANGLFFFDFWYGPAVLTDQPTVRVKRLEDDTMRVIRISEPLMHLNENIVDVKYEILIETNASQTVKRLQETHRMRYLFYPELEWMARASGLHVVRSLEWMSVENGLNPRNWNGAVILRK